MGERQEHHPPRFALISSLYRSIRKYHLLSFVRFHLCLAVASFLFWFLVSSQRSCGCGCTRPTKDLPTRSKARLGMIGARSFANFRFARRGHIHKPSSPQAHSTHFACIQPLSKSNTCPHCHTHTHIHTHTYLHTHARMSSCLHAHTTTSTGFQGHLLRLVRLPCEQTSWHGLQLTRVDGCGGTSTSTSSSHSSSSAAAAAAAAAAVVAVQ